MASACAPPTACTSVMPSSAQAASTAGCGRPPNSLCGGTRDRDLCDPGGLGRDHVHHHGRRVGDEAAWHVDAGPLDGDEPGGDGEPRRGRGVRAARELRLVDHPGAARGLLESVPDLRVDGVQGAARGLLAGTRVCARSTPSNRLVYSRTAAPPRTRTSSVIGLTRSTARSTSRAARGSTPSSACLVSPSAARPRRSITVVTGLTPLSEVTCPVYERPQAGRRTVRMLDSRVSRVSRVSRSPALSRQRRRNHRGWGRRSGGCPIRRPG